MIYPDSRAAFVLCQTTPVAETFDIDALRGALTKLMDRDQIKRKPLAKAAGLGETAVRDIFEKGANVRASTLVKLADYFSVSVDELAGRPRVALAGKIGAGGSIVFEENSDPQTVARPPIGKAAMVALEVQGDSMLPKYEPGDVIYIDRDRPGILPEYVGEYCAVRLKDGSTFLKKLMPGSRPDVFTLVSLNAGDMTDVEVEWATPVRFVMPRRSRS